MPADTDKEQYEETRRRFQELDVEEQASFLVEATASTLARGVVRAGEALADGIEDVVRRARHEASSTGSAGAAEPETSERQAPRTDASESNAGE